MKLPPFIRPPATPGELIVMPKASLSTRKVITKNTSSFRGARVTDIDDREVLRESTYEDGFALIFEKDRDVAWYEEQPTAVRYRDDDGRDRKHTFDFRVHLRCGTRVAYAVKAARRVVPTGIRRTLDLIEAQVGKHFADEYHVVTEQHLAPSRVANATLTIHARHVRDNDEVARLAKFVAGTRGDVRIAVLLEASGLGMDGFISAVNLLDDGVLKLVSPGVIDVETLVRANRATH